MVLGGDRAGTPVYPLDSQVAYIPTLVAGRIEVLRQVRVKHRRLIAVACAHPGRVCFVAAERFVGLRALGLRTPDPALLGLVWVVVGDLDLSRWDGSRTFFRTERSSSSTALTTCLDASIEASFSL